MAAPSNPAPSVLGEQGQIGLLLEALTLMQREFPAPHGLGRFRQHYGKLLAHATADKARREVFLAHQQADPHCSCSTCLEAHEAMLNAGEAAAHE